MKKIVVGILGAALVLGAGTAVFAAGNSGNGISFEKMLPFMQKMHPDSSQEELEGMYKACHGNGGGMMQGTNRMNSMMSDF